jgi:small subunit ribosomal protein S7
MSRRNRAVLRDWVSDPVYNSKIVTRLINYVMRDGKKGIARTIVYGTLELVQEKTGKDALSVLEVAINNVSPALEVKARRVGGANYQVPIEVRSERRITLALRWLVLFARKRNERGMVLKLAGEVMDAANGTGGAAKKREDTHKMAEANKAFAHYRW